MLPLLLLLIPAASLAQFTSQTYPDPRIDPLSCRLAFASPVCDPSAVVTDEERVQLVRKLQTLRAVTANIRNTSPACALQPERNLEITVAIIDKIGTVPGYPVDIEKFANNLKRRYQNFQDIGACDPNVLIVNSRQDRQVYTVAGRDARISKEQLKSAFERNIVHFKSGRYALGIEGMIEIIVAAYTNAHIIQTPTLDSVGQPEFVAANVVPAEVGQFRAAGLPNSVQPAKKNFETLVSEEIDEKDQVWVNIMQQAMARCGGDTTNLSTHVRAVVEEAMAISLKLIQDSRYNTIEEQAEAQKDVLGIRDRAWEEAKNEFIVPLFNKYRSTISSPQQVCPSISLRTKRRT